MKIKLPKPFEFDGRTIEELDADLEGLSGRDMSDIKRRWTSAGNVSIGPMALDADFDIMVLQKAVKPVLPKEWFEALPGPTWLYLSQAVGNFLATQGWK